MTAKQIDLQAKMVDYLEIISAAVGHGGPFEAVFNGE